MDRETIFRLQVNSPIPWVDNDFEERLKRERELNEKRQLTLFERETLNATLGVHDLDALFFSVESEADKFDLFLNQKELGFNIFQIGRECLPKNVEIVGEGALGKAKADASTEQKIRIETFPTREEILRRLFLARTVHPDVEALYHERVHLQFYPGSHREISEFIKGKAEKYKTATTEAHAQLATDIVGKPDLVSVCEVLTSHYHISDKDARRALAIVNTLKGQGFRDRIIAESIQHVSNSLSGDAFFNQLEELIRERWRKLGVRGGENQRKVLRRYGYFLEWRQQKLNSLIDEASNQVLSLNRNVSESRIRKGSTFFVFGKLLPSKMAGNYLIEFGNDGKRELFSLDKLSGMSVDRRRKMLQLVLALPPYSFKNLTELYSGDTIVRQWIEIRNERALIHH